MFTTVIGAYPKPNNIKITDWFNAAGGTDTEHPTKFYNNEIKEMGYLIDEIRLGLCLNYAVFLYEVKNQKKDALRILKSEIHDALDDYDKWDPEQMEQIKNLKELVEKKDALIETMRKEHYAAEEHARAVVEEKIA